jgi:hypothetical protein
MRRATAIALTTVFLAVNLPRQRVEAQAVLPAPVAACAAIPTVCIVGTLIIGGITYFTVMEGGSTEVYSEEGEYLEDPEGESEDWSDYVSARDEAAAQRVCADYARRAYAVLKGVRRVRGQTYECQFRTYRA